MSQILADNLVDNWPELSRPPSAPGLRGQWRARLGQWRDDAHKAVEYDDALYASSELGWTRSCFTCGMVMLWDEALRPPHGELLDATGFLEQSEELFGSLDTVVLWHAYPRIGFDDRNQLDYYREVPGGTAGLAHLVGQCHDVGTRVLLAYYPWDSGTRRGQEGKALPLLDIVRAVGADGVFLDTLGQASAELLASMAPGASPLALMTEDFVPLGQVARHAMSWAQWPPETPSPYILRNKWFEPRHMQFLVRRWHQDHSNELHLAWLNGAGVVVWENVFGSENPWSGRDRELLLKMRPVQRALGSVFSTGSWEPLVETCQERVYASRWEVDGLRLWALANMGDAGADGPLVSADVPPGEQLWDLVRGVEVEPVAWRGAYALAGQLEAGGIGAFAATTRPARRQLGGLLHGHRPVQVHRPLAGPVTAAEGATTGRACLGARSLDEGPVPPTMSVVTAGERELTVRYRLRECGMDGPAPLAGAVFPALHGVVTERRTIAFGAFAIDDQPVTNEEYLRFLAASHYRPAQPGNFLRHWQGPFSPPDGELGSPVTFVSAADALAYCDWAGKRLATPEEWQLAMEQGGIGYGPRRVWEWTGPECSDGHTRYFVLKGGSDYQAMGSEWYADGGPHAPDWRAKFISYWPGLDRCATVGFRSALDLPGSATTTPRRAGRAGGEGE